METVWRCRTASDISQHQFVLLLVLSDTLTLLVSYDIVDSSDRWSLLSHSELVVSFQILGF